MSAGCWIKPESRAMKQFKSVKGPAIPMNSPNIDTDQLLPARFLRKDREAGLGQYLLYDQRFGDSGAVQEHFILNHPRFRDAPILITQRNFGCGSSREYAVYALMDFGIQVVIAPSFGGILYNNSVKNGLLPVVLAEQAVDKLLTEVEANPDMDVSVDLRSQEVSTAGGTTFRFEIDPFSKQCLLDGLDDLGLALLEMDRIKSFEKRQAISMPWLDPTGASRSGH
jgi:3-isopropylmalate/(R)-2-methylmalate dehydratase small subunit